MRWELLSFNWRNWRLNDWFSNVSKLANIAAIAPSATFPWATPDFKECLKLCSLYLLRSPLSRKGFISWCVGTRNQTLVLLGHSKGPCGDSTVELTSRLENRRYCPAPHPKGKGRDRKELDRCWRNTIMDLYRMVFNPQVGGDWGRD